MFRVKWFLGVQYLERPPPFLPSPRAAVGAPTHTPGGCKNRAPAGPVKGRDSTAARLLWSNERGRLIALRPTNDVMRRTVRRPALRFSVAVNPRAQLASRDELAFALMVVGSAGMLTARNRRVSTKSSCIPLPQSPTT